MKKWLSQSWLILGLIGGGYLVSHLYNLLLLPVFADESIYIRWSQLIVEDTQRYLFFPLNDGKTPLFMWLLAPFQLISADQLWLARIVSVVIGLLQVGATGWLLSALGGRRKTIYLGMLLTTILPFWFMHHRLALIDSLLALTLTLAWIGGVKLTQAKSWSIPWTLWTGWWLGVALWTKLPALLAFPALLSCFILLKKPNRSSLIRLSFSLGVSAGVGLAIFALLRVSPSFGQLFSRGSDFLYPLMEVLQGKWQETLPNIFRYSSYFIRYLTTPLVILILIGLFLPRKERIHFLWWSAVLFGFPILLLGKVVYPRYFLPMMVWLTPAAALAAQHWWARFVAPHQRSPRPDLAKIALGGLLLFTLLGQTLATSVTFALNLLTKPEQTPLVQIDQEQYLAEWSSGHGIPEALQLINDLRATQSVAVATEGSFGTLPDGLLLYYFRRPVENLYIEGVGQPVTKLSEQFLTRAQSFDRSLLVVNSHRLKMSLSADSLLQETCRPLNGPCLQVWDVTELVK